ncbi:hypothetical protein [Rhodoferax sp.]|uniref:hypothetical protein n=1 Tax=Rhodoferax sp. TaxID=50421 RepID=UPI0025F3C25A|nr:hypothetical protein [Rhodoferax sp.]
MTITQIFAVVAVALCFVGMVLAAMAALIAHRAARAATAAHHATAQLLREFEVRSAVSAASAVLAEATRAQQQANELSRAYGMLALFSRTFGEAEMQKSQEMADSQADLAGAIATQAKAFVAAHRDVSDPTPENLDKAVNDFEKALVAVRSMRAEVERELEGVESQRGELR